MTATRQRRLSRASLLLSVAALGSAVPAFAAENDKVDYRIDRDAAQLVPFSTSAAPTSNLNLPRVDLEPQIVIGAPGTPTTALDPVNVTGIGQMVIDNRDGSVGLCTGTLINPRTVIFAAHCVNSRAQTAYGANSGGTAIGFGFASNNNAAGASAFGGWLNGIAGGARYLTNPGRFMYNVNALAYHPASLEPAAETFLYGDVALASLDTPAEGIPTWAVMFSPLPATAGGPNGTGYHVNIAGYGNNGTGATGSSGGIDFRRRAAENMLGALASIDDVESSLFGAGSGLNQNLYWVDFDDPRRGTAAADPRDFNLFRDNPQAREGITAAGDSGGPLILDRTYARQVVIGVLSGGYTRFFANAPANGYGTASFYQPLYLYWDWIAANNPYRYVGNVAGSRNWNDPTNWVSLVDPNYQILGPNGQLITGVPSLTGETTTGTSGKFGELCFEGPANGGLSQCRNLRTGTETVTVRPIGTGAALTNDAATAPAGELRDSAASLAFIDGVEVEPQAPARPIPAPTITNGLPGATNFTPNNSAGNRTAGVLPRYFDVTLSAAGTTTLDTAVVVDKFTLAGVQAGLTITSTGSLTSLQDVTQVVGTMQIDGTLRAPSDFFFLAGGLSGTGQIFAPFTTSAAGVIAPGSATTVGTLTFNGNLILASGTSYLVNLGSGVSDLIAVRRVNGTQGQANVGGALSLSFTSALRANQSFTILTAEGGVTGAFATPGAFSAILSPTLNYTSTAIVLNVRAGNYTSVVSPSNAAAFAYARLLDQNRSVATNWDALYGPLDLQNAATINSTLIGLTPAIESTVQTLGIAAVDANSGFIRTRLQSLDPSDMGGTLAHYGQPVQVAAVNLSSLGGMTVQSDTAAPMIEEGKLPETVSAFVAGGYIDGRGRGMTGVGGRDRFDGWYVGAGIEASIEDSGLIGFAFNYSKLDGAASFPGQLVKQDALQGTLYFKTVGSRGLVLDGQVSAGAIGADTTRSVNFLNTPYTLRAEDNALAIASELAISQNLGNDTFAITPRIAGRATTIDFGSALERGGPMALNLKRETYRSIQGRAGLTVAANSASVRPFVTGTYVHEFQDQPDGVAANLVGGIGGVRFALNGQDQDWGEISGGLTIKSGDVDLSIAADTTIERSDLSVQSYRATVSFKF